MQFDLQGKSVQCSVHLINVETLVAQSKPFTLTFNRGKWAKYPMLTATDWENIKIS